MVSIEELMAHIYIYICMLAAAVLYDHVTVSRCLTLMGKPLGKSTKGKAKA